MTKIINIINIVNDKPSNLDSLKKISDYKNPVWVLIKCKTNVAFWEILLQRIFSVP